MRLLLLAAVSLPVGSFGGLSACGPHQR